MPPAASDKSDKVTSHGGAWSKNRPQPDFFAKIVPLDTVCHFCRLNSDGDRAASWIAEHQLGLVTTRQLAAAGMSRDAIRTRCKRSSLHRVHQGVYLFGTAILLPGARELAAVLACGDSAVVSHRAAAWLWRFALRVPDDIDITIVGQNRRRRAGIRIHRVDALEKRDLRLKNGIPITSPARTLLDFAAQAGADELEQAIAESYALGLSNERELDRVVELHPHRPGAGALKAQLSRAGGPALTRSEAERLMKALIRGACLPPAIANAPVAGVSVDFLWPAARLVVEIDGYRYHGHRRAFERDRRKGLVLEAAGYRVLRISWRQLVEEPLVIAATLAVALAGSAPHGLAP